MKKIHPAKYAAAVLACFSLNQVALGQGATVTMDPPDTDKPAKVILSAGNGAELEFYRNLWQAMKVRTAEGKEINITDLFFYSTNVGKDPANSGYWTDPERWDKELTFRSGAAGNDGAGVKIIGQRGPLSKTVSAAIYPGDPAVYVINRLATAEEVKIDGDPHTAYFGLPPQDPKSPSDVFVDGENKSHVFDEEVQAQGKSFLYTYFPGLDMCLAILSLPKEKLSIKTKSPLEYRNRMGDEEKWGREFIVRGIGGPLKPGEEIDLRYVIYWNDGDRLDEVKSLAERLNSGALDDRFVEEVKQ